MVLTIRLTFVRLAGVAKGLRFCLLARQDTIVSLWCWRTHVLAGWCWPSDWHLCFLQALQRDFAFCLLARQNPIRNAVIVVVENPWFGRVVLAIIMANCIFLAIANPLCDTEVEIRTNPACAANPAKWQTVSLLPSAIDIALAICTFVCNLILYVVLNWVLQLQPIGNV